MKDVTKGKVFMFIVPLGMLVVVIVSIMYAHILVNGGCDYIHQVVHTNNINVSYTQTQMEIFRTEMLFCDLADMVNYPIGVNHTKELKKVSE